MRIINDAKKNSLLKKSYKILRSFMWVVESEYKGKKNKEQIENKVVKKYKKISGKDLNWNNLKTFNEKIQWAKLYENIPIKTKLSDKYLVREWVSEVIGRQYLIPLLGVWESFDEIEFTYLPNEFVLKTNHAAGTNIIVSDKSEMDKKEAKILFDNWLRVNYAYFNGYQMQYENIKPKILAEKFIHDKAGELPEYKFFCFGGEVYYCWEILGRGTKEFRNIYDLNWDLQPWVFKGHENSPFKSKKPKNFNKMVSIARKLSEGLSHVRVDLYNVDDKIYFGEMTFTNTGGTRPIVPEKYDFMLGELWELDINRNN